MTAIRFFLASVVVAATLSGALILHWHQAVWEGCAPSDTFCTPGYTSTLRPHWQYADPAALVVLALGIGIAGSILAVKRRSP
jgi:hypothetical protein